ncbi:MAG: Cas9 endonuclease PAM-interacting domain-containing protein [Lactobacillus sp.]
MHAGREKFQILSLSEQESTLKNILDGLHANAKMTNIKNIGISISLGFMQYQSGVLLSPDALVVYQSPTGLFERRVKISDL